MVVAFSVEAGGNIMKCLGTSNVYDARVFLKLREGRITMLMVSGILSSSEDIRVVG